MASSQSVVRMSAVVTKSSMPSAVHGSPAPKRRRSAHSCRAAFTGTLATLASHLNRKAMGAIRDWATPENLQPEPITVEIWRELPEEFCRQVEVVNGQAVRCDSPSRAHQTAVRRLADMLESSADEYTSLHADSCLDVSS